MPAAKEILVFLPKEIFTFFYWWYFEVPEQFLLFSLKLLGAYLDRMSVSVMLRTLFTPMFHDYTITGRSLSFFFRVSRILFGLFVNLLMSVVLIIFFLTWLIIPVLVSLSFYLSLRR